MLIVHIKLLSAFIVQTFIIILNICQPSEGTKHIFGYYGNYLKIQIIDNLTKKHLEKILDVLIILKINWQVIKNIKKNDF
jgi:hypothetical protein